MTEGHRTYVADSHEVDAMADSFETYALGLEHKTRLQARSIVILSIVNVALSILLWWRW